MKDLEEFTDEKFVSLVADVVSDVLPHDDAIALTAEVGRRLSAATAAVAAAAASLPRRRTLAELVARIGRGSEPFPLIKP